MSTKVSIRFYKDSKVRGVWDDEQNKWFFSVLDIIGAINEQEDYQKNRNYWKYLKAKLKKEQSELVSATTQLKLLAPDGKRRLADAVAAGRFFILSPWEYDPSKRACHPPRMRRHEPNGGRNMRCPVHSYGMVEW